MSDGIIRRGPFCSYDSFFVLISSTEDEPVPPKLSTLPNNAVVAGSDSWPWRYRLNHSELVGDVEYITDGPPVSESIAVTEEFDSQARLEVSFTYQSNQDRTLTYDLSAGSSRAGDDSSVRLITSDIDGTTIDDFFVEGVGPISESGTFTLAASITPMRLDVLTFISRPLQDTTCSMNFSIA